MILSKLTKVQIISERFIDMSEDRPMFPVLFFQKGSESDQGNSVISMLVLTADKYGEIRVNAAQCVNPAISVLKSLSQIDIIMCKSSKIIDVSGKKVQKYQVCYDIDNMGGRFQFNEFSLISDQGLFKNDIKISMTGLREIISSNMEELANKEKFFSLIPFYGGFGSQ